MRTFTARRRLMRMHERLEDLREYRYTRSSSYAPGSSWSNVTFQCESMSVLAPNGEWVGPGHPVFEQAMSLFTKEWAG